MTTTIDGTDLTLHCESDRRATIDIGELAYNDNLRAAIRRAAGNERNITVYRHGQLFGAMPARPNHIKSR